MALITADRVRETTTTTGTGALTLGGAPTGFRTFASQMSEDDTAIVFIVARSGGAWECALATMEANGTLSRTTLKSSSTGSSIDFGSGTKDVILALDGDTIADILTAVAAAAAHAASTSNPHSVTAVQAGADPTGSAAAAQAHAVQRANHTGTQAISTVVDLQTGLDAKAPLASPALTGAPTAPTASAGTNTTQIATTAFVSTGIAGQPEVIQVACSDTESDLETGTVATFRMPFAMTLTAVRASVSTAPTGAALVVGINEGGSSVLSTDITIDAGDETSADADAPPVISDAALADDAEITIDIDQVGASTAGAGLVVTLIGTRA